MLTFFQYSLKRCSSEGLSRLSLGTGISHNCHIRQIVAARPRRHSSSKASNSSNDGSTALDTSTSPTSKNVTANTRRRSANKGMRTGSKDGHAKFDSPGSILSLPSVPSTQHLHSQDINLASFFSLHRPISVIAPVPPISTEESFSAIFLSTSKKIDKNVSFALSSAINRPATHDEEPQTLDRSRPLVSPGTKLSTETGYQDSQNLYIDIEEMTKNLRPFNPPPLPESSEEQVGPSNYGSISVGYKRSLTTTATPSIEIHCIARNSVFVPFSKRLRISHLRRMDRGNGSQKVVWNAISVRRQRKLKMKKHKYKKLMRRTRNLRRRQDRL